MPLFKAGIGPAPRLAKRLAYLPAGLPMHHRLLCVRRYSAPSDTASVEFEYSPTELVANNSNVGLARTTCVSPDWLVT